LLRSIKDKTAADRPPFLFIEKTKIHHIGSADIFMPKKSSCNNVWMPE
jgi:hypothetical protein